MSNEMMTPSERAGLDEAIKLADEMAAFVPDDRNLEAFWERPESDEALRLVRAAGYPPSEFIPGVEVALDFHVSGFAKRFYQSYAKQVRTLLCDEESDLRDAIGTAIKTGTGALIMALATALSLSLGAAVVIAPIAAILLVRGIDALCEMDDG